MTKKLRQALIISCKVSNNFDIELITKKKNMNLVQETITMAKFKIIIVIL